MTDHPIHLAGLYFACQDPEGQWIADMEAEAESLEDESPTKETEKSACSQSPSHS